jgi:hypothetical protein
MTHDAAPEPQTLIAALLGPAGPELTCEDCFEQLDRYVDLALAGIDADRAVPGMRAHLVGCPAWRRPRQPPQLRQARRRRHAAAGMTARVAQA